MSSNEPTQEHVTDAPATPGTTPSATAQQFTGPLQPQQGEMPFAVVMGQAMTELPKDLYIPPQALEVFLEAFEGPLDLLLYLDCFFQCQPFPGRFDVFDRIRGVEVSYCVVKGHSMGFTNVGVRFVQPCSVRFEKQVNKFPQPPLLQPFGQAVDGDDPVHVNAGILIVFSG